MKTQIGQPLHLQSLLPPRFVPLLLSCPRPRQGLGGAPARLLGEGRARKLLIDLGFTDLALMVVWGA